MGRKYGFGKLFKQISFYVLLLIAIPTVAISFIPDIAGVTGIPSMVIHLIALVIGVIFAAVFRKKINGYFVTETDAQIKVYETVKTC